MATAASNTNTIQATVRQPGGKNEARRVRVSGKLPATLYGAGEAPVSISVDPRQVAAVLHSATGHNTIFDVELEGSTTKAMIVDYQHEPIKGSLLHVDLKRIALDKKLTVRVPVILKGEAAGVKQQGGILEQVLREIELECLPTDIPANVEVDVSELVFGQVVRVKDLQHGGTLTFLTDEEQPVAHIVAVKETVEPTPAEAATEETPAAAEPEVIKKGKQETEEAPAAETKGKK
jgi:large subunit ribosomal protein L25